MVKMFRRGNGILYVEYKVNGKTVQKSTRLPDTPKNRSLVKKEVIPVLQRKLITGEIGLLKPRTFSFYASEYVNSKHHLKSFKLIENRVNLICETFGGMIVTDIKRSDIKRWVNDRLVVNTPKTVRDYLTDLRGIFLVAMDYSHISDNPAKDISLPLHSSQDIQPFTPDEVSLLLSKSNDWLRLYLSIGFYTGLRTGEILGLMRSDIDLMNGIISVRRNVTKGRITTPKTSKSFRDVPIFDELRPYLRDMPKTLWLFSKVDGSPFFDFPGNRRKQWKMLLNECNLSYRKIYATRHTFIVSMLKYSDLSLLEIAQLAGHSSTQMIIRNYAKFIKGEHLNIDRGLKLFADKTTDNSA